MAQPGLPGADTRGTSSFARSRAELQNGFGGVRANRLRQQAGGGPSVAVRPQTVPGFDLGDSVPGELGLRGYVGDGDPAQGALALEPAPEAGPLYSSTDRYSRDF